MAERRFVARYDVTARDTGSAVLERGARNVATAQRALRRELTATEAASAAAQRSIQRYGQAAGRSASGARSAENANRALDRSLERLVGSSARAARAHHQQANAAERARREVSRLGSAVRNAAALVGAGSVLFGGAAVIRQATQYEKALRDAGAMAELSAKQQERLGVVSRKVGVEQALGATESAKAAGELAKAGVKYKDVVSGALKSTADLSNAGDVSLPRAADAMAAAIGNFGLSGKKAAHVANELTSSSLSTRDSIEGVVNAMSMGSAAAAEVGYSFESTISAFTLIAQAGTLGARAGTTLRSALLRLVNPPKQAQDTIEKYGLKLKDQNGRLKQTADLSEELRSKLGHLGDAQQGAALKTLGGTYGFIALSGLMRKSGPEIEALEKRLARQGVAARIAQQRLQGLAGAQQQLKAAGQEASIRLSAGILPGLADVATAATDALGNAAVQRTLDRFGKQLGDKGQEFAAGFERAAEDGRLEDMLNGALSATTALAQTMTAVAAAAGKIASVWHEIPEGVRESGIQALVFAAVLKRVVTIAGALPFVGALGARGGAAAGAAAAAPGVVAGVGARRYSVGGPGGMPVGPLGVRQYGLPPAPVPAGPTPVAGALGAGYARNPALAQQALATARMNQTAALRASSAAQLAAIRNGSNGPMRNPLLVRAEAAQARANAAASRAQVANAERQLRLAQSANREMAAQQRAARVAAVRNRMPSAGAAAGVVAIGAGAAAISGGNTGTAAMTGALVGSMMGPWGAAGGAIAAAAGSELTKWFREEGRKEAEAFGDRIASGIGKGLDPKRQKQIGAQERAIRRSQERDAARQAGPDTPVGQTPGATLQPSMETIRRQQQQGRSIAFGVQQRFNRKDFIDPRDVVKLTTRQFKGADQEVQRAGAASMLAWLRGLEGKKGVAKGAAVRIVSDLGGSFGAFDQIASKAIKGTAIRDALGAAVGGQKRRISDLLNDNFKSFSGLEKPAKITYRNVVSEAQKQLKVLAEKTRSGSKESREAAADEFQKLSSAVIRFLAGTSPVVDKFGRDAKIAIGQLKPSISEVKGELGTLADTWADLSRTFGSFEAPNLDATSGTNSRTQRHVGGVVRRRFNFGGVAVAASAGEGMVFPDGSFAMVPGHQFPQDNVHLTVPDNTAFITRDGLGLAGLGASLQQILDLQRPHYGEPQRFAGGGTASAGIGPARAAQAYRNAGFTGTPLVRMTAISGAESRWRPGAVSPPNFDGSRDYGLSQVNNKAHPRYFKQPGRILEAGYNARAAWDISGHGSNFGPWSTWKSGAWKQYESQARAAALRSRKENAVGDSFDDKTLNVPILVSRSTRGRTGLLDDAFGSALSRAIDGRGLAFEGRAGRGTAATVAAALAQVKTMREITARGGGGGDSTDGKNGSVKGTPVLGAKPGFGPIMDRIRSKYGSEIFVMSGSRPGATVAGSGKPSNHSTRNAVDISTPNVRSRTSANPAPPGHKLDNLYSRLRGVGRPPTLDLLWRTNQGGNHFNHIHWGLADSAVRTVAAGRAMAQRLRGGGIAGRPRFAAGGVVGGGVNNPLRIAAKDVASTPGGSRNYFDRLADAIDIASTSYIEKIRRQIQEKANRGGLKATIAKFQAALDVIDDRLGARAGSLAANAASDVSGRERTLSNVAAIQRIRGVDPASEQGIRDQMFVERRFLAGAGDRRANLAQAQKIAERNVARAAKTGDQDKIDAAAQALESVKNASADYEAQVLESRAALAEHQRALVEAAAVVREAAQVAAAAWAEISTSTLDDANAKRQEADNLRQRANETNDVNAASQFRAQAAAADREAQRLARRDGLAELDRDAALAALTDGTGDDLDVARRREAALQRALDDAKATSDVQDITDIAGQLKGIRDEIKAGNAEAAQSAEALLEITREESRRKDAVIASLSGSERAIAAVTLAAFGEGVRSVSGLGNWDPYTRTSR